METGEFFIYFALIAGTCFIANKILKLIEWKMKYDVSVKKSMDALDEFIKEGDLK